MIQVVLLGFGNVGQHLFNTLNKSIYTSVIQIYNRNKDTKNTSVAPLFTTSLNSIKEADLYIIAISDDAIASFSEKLPFKNKLVVHTSGSVAINLLSNKNRKGVFYPLQSFTKNKKVDFSEIPICVEAEKKEDLLLLKKVAASISENVQEINSKEREKLHLSAVIVNNFVNYLYQVGSDLLKEESLSFELLKPLIKETAHKIEELTPFDAQTGPAKRNDKKTIEKQILLLKNSPHQKLYKEMTKAILQKYKTNT